MPDPTSVLDQLLLSVGVAVDGTRLRVLDDAAIRSAAPREVTSPGTIDTGLISAPTGPTGPIPGGLFCPEIFGADGDRLGRVEFPVPVVHPWALNVIASLLGISRELVAAVAAGSSTLGGEEPETLEQTGATALRTALDQVDLEAIASVRGSPRTGLARSFIEANRRPAALCFTAWPVLAPACRPLEFPHPKALRPEPGTVNELYFSLLCRTRRFHRLIELGAPPVILRVEAYRLQEAVNVVVQNELTPEPKTVKQDGDDEEQAADRPLGLPLSLRAMLVPWLDIAVAGGVLFDIALRGGHLDRSTEPAHVWMTA